MSIITTQQLKKDFIKEATNDGIMSLNQLKRMKRKLLTGSGIYFLFKHNTIVYVGQTTNGLKKVFDHTDKNFDEYVFVRCRKSELNVLEAAYIKKFRPKYNITHNTDFQRIKNKRKDKKRGFKIVPNKCTDCGTVFDVLAESCPNCYGTNIKFGGRFKVNKAKEQLTEEVTDDNK